MGWGNRWPEREPRPKLQPLSDEQGSAILALLTSEIKESPVLTALGMRVRFLRGRFYVESVRPDPPDGAGIDGVARLTPIAGSRITLLLEKEGAKGGWREVARGSPKQLSRMLVEDPKGAFHGLGALDAGIRRARENGLERLKLVRKGKLGFVHADDGSASTVQEVLFHYFGMPIEVVAEPRRWYALKRQPRIAEVSRDRTAVLVRFSAFNLSFGTEFSGTCLYIRIDGAWRDFTIKPNRSESIAQAVAWLESRQWQGWSA